MGATHWDKVNLNHQGNADRSRVCNKWVATALCYEKRYGFRAGSRPGET